MCALTMAGCLLLLECHCELFPPSDPQAGTSLSVMTVFVGAVNSTLLDVLSPQADAQTGRGLSRVCLRLDLTLSPGTQPTSVVSMASPLSLHWLFCHNTAEAGNPSLIIPT